ncbi:MAG: NADPH-dependent 7-cyano-7-deazaguanine reductase QueF [Pseudomonadota bacterium]
MAEPPEHLAGAPLGRPTPYPERFDAGLLHPIDRATGRAALDWTGVPEPYGTDLWVAYELSWLSATGMPRVAIAEFEVPCDSPRLIESKSLKLYLNSLNQTAFAGPGAVEARLRADLSAACGAGVAVRLYGLAEYGRRGLSEPPGTCLDGIDLEAPPQHPSPRMLRVRPGEVTTEMLHSDLLKTHCPVTGQPDWATLILEYRGSPIDRAGLLAYVVSLRRHSDFHEHCVERIFCDLWRQLRPERLSVVARYTRRGGIEINPWRSSQPGAAPGGRLPRQ